MDLTPDDVRDVVRALDGSGLDELHLELADLTLTVRREGAAGWTAEQEVRRRPAVERAEPAETADPASTPGPAGAAVPEGTVAVHPPLLGTFYRAPQPGAPPYVEVGDEVDAETVVGIVETMKMMTPVHAGVRGTVTEFRTANGEFADTDAVLLVVEPAP
ncbi:acetyl-CoA carboxylase biotin carboxyl carrier protein [Actinomycetospora straminea]|uniref:Biotin carboxyl carrier protein of acetyl-CoA carboxylase n=1 Tax=Actinomycetospora straminea TaxID=663607 RepID=A0ABP9F9X8_9PSEU|nr:biotin/lipoyl-containing protein [Actinomycetospora straminea]MDD7936726.1 acetyl-CoA carboxylase biotin carboxyl carrier protein subunit [Actinomycetospora straminea]